MPLNLQNMDQIVFLMHKISRSNIYLCGSIDFLKRSKFEKEMKKHLPLSKLTKNTKIVHFDPLNL